MSLGPNWGRTGTPLPTHCGSIGSVVGSGPGVLPSLAPSVTVLDRAPRGGPDPPPVDPLRRLGRSVESAQRYRSDAGARTPKAAE